MKTEIRMAAVVGAFLALGTLPGSAQTVQTLSVNVTAYDHAGAKQIKITNKELITYFTGTNIPGARLLLVTPSPNDPGTLGNLGAYLQVVKNNEVIVEVPSPDAFNVYQDYASNKSSGTRTATHAIDRFSVEFGGFLAELQGFSIWNTSGGSGAFVANVNGAIFIDGVTDDWVPARGTITASAPKPAQ